MNKKVLYFIAALIPASALADNHYNEGLYGSATLGVGDTIPALSTDGNVYSGGSVGFRTQKYDVGLGVSALYVNSSDDDDTINSKAHEVKVGVYGSMFTRLLNSQKARAKFTFLADYGKYDDAANFQNLDLKAHGYTFGLDVGPTIDLTDYLTLNVNTNVVSYMISDSEGDVSKSITSAEVSGVSFFNNVGVSLNVYFK